MTTFEDKLKELRDSGYQLAIEHPLRVSELLRAFGDGLHDGAVKAAQDIQEELRVRSELK
jgi:hypothetical protein